MSGSPPTPPAVSDVVQMANRSRWEGTRTARLRYRESEVPPPRPQEVPSRFTLRNTALWRRGGRRHLGKQQRQGHRPMLDERDEAWAEVYAVLPADWVVLRPMWRETGRMWVVYARSTARSSDAQPWAEAFGETEAIALRALAQQFRTGLAQPLPILRGKAWIERARK